MPKVFLFGDVSTELIFVSVLGAVICIAGLIAGVAQFVRFYRTRSRRTLLAGIMHILFAPILGFSLFLLDGWLIKCRIGSLWLGEPSSLLGAPTGNQ